MDLKGLVSELLSELGKVSQSDAVVGTVRDAGKAKVLPLSKISIGFGTATGEVGGSSQTGDATTAGASGGGSRPSRRQLLGVRGCAIRRDRQRNSPVARRQPPLSPPPLTPPPPPAAPPADSPPVDSPPLSPPPPPAQPTTPLTVRVSTIGIVSPQGGFGQPPATWYLRNGNSPGAPDVTPFDYGHPGWGWLSGDWDGDGITTLAVFSPTGGFGQPRQPHGSDVPGAFGAFGAQGGFGGPPQSGYGAQPMGGQPGYGGGTVGPMPPDMQWWLVLVIGFVCGFFPLYWLWKQASFVERIDPTCPAKKFYVMGFLCVIGGYILSFMSVLFATGRLTELAVVFPMVGMVVVLCGAVLIIMASFKMRAAIHNYYTMVEPMGINLMDTTGAILTFFFAVYFFQYNFAMIAERKKAMGHPAV